MRFHVLTLFPEMIEQGMHTSITGRAMDKGLLSLHTVNIRDFSLRGDGRIDDYPYGGGAGMVMQAEPIMRAYEAVLEQIQAQDPGRLLSGGPRVICLAPQGQVFRQKMAAELARETDLIFLCGHYEGMDERVLQTIVTDRVSIGDYVLTGGELPAMVMMDAISRMVPGVLTNEASGLEESFSNGLLEYPQYSRPEIWRDQPVPPVLLSGHHGNVDRWRRNKSLVLTLRVRPELLEGQTFDKKDRKFFQALLHDEWEEVLTEEEKEKLRGCISKLL